MPARTRPLLPALAAAAFLAMLGLVLGDWGPLQRADEALSAEFRSYGTAFPRVISVVRVVTDVMGTLSFLTIGLAGTVLLLAARSRRAAGFCAAVTVSVPVLWGAAHALLYRPRPANGFVDIHSNGFPSGHTAHATATALLVLLLLWPRLGTAGRVTAVALGAVLAVAIGLTRVALLAHWPTDVLGGWLLSLAVVPALALAFGRPPVGPPVGPPAGPPAGPPHVRSAPVAGREEGRRTRRR
jgi:undecaprenyl-diphosphatase